jgi:hypothetical protein
MEAATAIMAKAATHAARIERKDGSKFYLKWIYWFSRGDVKCLG